MGIEEKPLVHLVPHLQDVFIVCCICRLFTLWSRFLASANYTSRGHWGEFIPGFDGSYPASFLSSFLLSGHPRPPLLVHPRHNREQRPSPFLSPSPTALSQLPVELAAVQGSADGSVIRSASLRSFSSSSLFFLPFNQITKDNFMPFGNKFLDSV